MAKAYLKEAAAEGDPARQQALATLALAAANLAHAEAQWLTGHK